MGPVPPAFAALIGSHLHSASKPRRNAGWAAEIEECMTVKHPKPGLTISDSHFDEQFPLAPIDDYMIHQTPDPVRVVWSTDPRIYERFWVICHDNKGELLLSRARAFTRISIPLKPTRSLILRVNILRYARSGVSARTE
jgi:hypothetical protein